MRRERSPARTLSHGLSIVEMLVGMTIGLYIVAGSSALFVANVASSRRLALETRINQDLRATLDLMTRDLRRGGYWGDALAGTIASASSGATQTNPYAMVSAGPTDDPKQVLYSYTRDATENNKLDSNEVFGFRLASGTIQMCMGGSIAASCTNWQALSNTDIVTISGFSITPNETEIDLRAVCAINCADTAVTPACPRIRIRRYDIALTGTATTDPTLSRTLRSKVRVRNDALLGSCPA